MYDNKRPINININKNILYKAKKISLINEVSICDIIESTFLSFDIDSLSHEDYKQKSKENSILRTEIDICFWEKIIQISKVLFVPRSYIVEKILEYYINQDHTNMNLNDKKDEINIIKTDIYVNKELLLLYKKLYNKDSQSNKNVIENLVTDDLLLDKNFITISDKKTIKDHIVCSYLDSCKYKNIKLKSFDENISVGDFFNYYFIQKIKEKDVIDINKYLKKDELQLEFPEEILKYKLDSKVKVEIDDEIIKKKIKLYKFNGDVNNVIYNLYKMMFIFKYSMKEINKCFNSGTSPRQIQKIIKKLGWTLSKEEIQQRAVKRGIRDYNQVKTTTKETLLKNSQIGSKPEDYARHLINHKLTRIFPEYEIIVGLNNLSILNNGKEIDIPIIIIKGEEYYKFAIEYQGVYWHDSEERIQEDNLKKEIIFEKGYNLFYIVEEKQYTDKQRKLFIEEELDKIILKIRDTINKQQTKRRVKLKW